MDSGVKEDESSSDKVTLTGNDESLKIGEPAERLESEVEEEEKKKEDVKNTLKDFAYQMKGNIKDGTPGAKLDPVERRKIEKVINKAIRLVGMKKKSPTLKELEKQLEELEVACVPVIAKIWEESVIAESARNIEEVD